MSKIPVCLQMYTVRDDAGKDFAGTVQKVAQIGYAGVELAGYGNATPADAKKILDDNGLLVCGSHVGLNVLEDDLERAVEEAKLLGVRYVVCPFLPQERRGDGKGYRKLGAALNEIGRTLKAEGIGFAYHNHDFELKEFDGHYGLDILFGASEPEFVQVELDTFWVKKAGVDPVAYLEKYTGRVPLVHLKDMDEEGRFAEVGEGTIDYGALLPAAERAGAQYYVVEQDRTFNHPPLESVALSFANLKKMGAV